MTTKGLTALETAILARDKGFPQDGTELHDMYNYMSQPLVFYADGTYNSFWFNIEPENRVAVRPTLTVLRTWLREQHGIHVQVIPFKTIDTNKTFYCYLISEDIDSDFTSNDYLDYDECLEEGLVQALNVMEQINKTSE